MNISEFDYHLPEALIAQAPVTPRDASRLLVLGPEGPPAHRAFVDLPALLAPGDLLVFNDTRVIPARLVGRKASGGRVELLLCEPLEGGLGRRWRAMGQASKPIRAGAELAFDGLSARVDAVEGEGFYAVTLDREGPALAEALARAGRIPLPPYIRRAPSEEDAERYQTIWARAPGSAAAPTAGLHFTPRVLEALAARGVERASVTLHVGPGTFLPVRADDLDAHHMHAERYSVPPETAQAFAACRARGGRVVAVGTTTLRTLESAALGSSARESAALAGSARESAALGSSARESAALAGSAGEAGLSVGEGRTELFVRPGHAFRAVDALVTNFHLPRSTLLVLVCAFAGTERTLAAYREAVAQRYRFFSYGDAMLLVRRG